jgi:hypothetical protein
MGKSCQKVISHAREKFSRSCRGLTNNQVKFGRFVARQHGSIPVKFYGNLPRHVRSFERLGIKSIKNRSRAINCAKHVFNTARKTKACADRKWATYSNYFRKPTALIKYAFKKK